MNKAYSLLEVKSVNDEQRVIKGIATSPRPDRTLDVVDPFGVKVAADIPLFLYHDSTKTVGRATFGKPTSKGIPFEARLPHIAEPGALKDRVDEAWGMVKHRLITAVSIGFRVLDGAVENIKGGGYKYLSTEVMELSLVPVPAQPDAEILGWKSMGEDAQKDALLLKAQSIDTAMRAASGIPAHGSQPTAKADPPPGESGTKKQPASGGFFYARTKGKEIMKTYSEQISDLESTRAAKAARMAEVMQKSIAEGRSTDMAEGEEFDTIEQELKTIDADLVRLKKLEKLNIEKAAPVNTQTPGGHMSLPVQVKNTQKLEPGVEFARYAMCLFSAKGDHDKALRIAKSVYPENERIVNTLDFQSKSAHSLGSLMQQKANVNAGTSLDSTWAAPLVDYQTFSGDFVEYLRPMTIIGKFGSGGIPGLRRIPFNVRITGQTSGGSGYWVGEGAPKPLTKFDFNAVELRWAKVANIAVLTEELMRFSNPSAERLVRDALAAALIERLDIDFIDPDKAAVANVSPASITNGVSPISAGGATTDDSIRAAIKALWAPFITANNPPSSAVYIMSASRALSLSLRFDALGNRSFPGISINGGTFLGIPVIVSEYVKNDGGSAGDLVILANASDIWLADDGQVTIDASREASLQMDDAPSNNSATGTESQVVSMFQTNSVALRAERFINWQKRRSSAVQYLDAVTW